MSVDKDKIFFLIEGKVYDLKEWIPKHPGGSLWFNRCFNRDITSIVYTYHRDPKRIKSILTNYEVKHVKYEEIEDEFYNCPRFVLPEDFNIKNDLMRFDWNLDSLYKKTLKNLDTPEWKAKLKRADILFDITAFILFLFHVFLSYYCVFYNLLPFWVLVFLQVCTRTSMGAVGHYHVHRAKNGIKDWGDFLFDM